MEIDQLSYELNVTLPQAIATAVEMGDLRENSEYKAALERQQFVQARLGQLHQRMQQVTQLANHEAPTDRVGLGSKVKVLDLGTDEVEEFMVVLAELMDIDAGHISLASPLGRALADRRWAMRCSSGCPPSPAGCACWSSSRVHDAEPRPDDGIPQEAADPGRRPGADHAGGG